MSYQAYDVARLHGRDAVFLSRYLLNKALGKTKNKRLILCNSYPKSGTHLLYQILYSIPGLNKWDDIVSVQALCGVMNTSSHVHWKLGSAPDQSIVRCHLMHCEEINQVLQEFDSKVIFVYRDLRDVAVSHARWVMKEPRIFLHQYYSRLKDFDRQLMYSIKGVPVGTPFGSNISQPDIGQDFLRWQKWLDEPTALAIKFEDLVGKRGGGCEETRLKMIKKIVDYLDIDLSWKQIETTFASDIMNPQESHTFRKGAKGKIGGWKTVFKPDHKTAFKQVAGNLLIELGYESDFNW